MCKIDHAYIDCFVVAAVKCNDDTAVLRILADLGVNFDCASKVLTGFTVEGLTNMVMACKL